MPTDIKNFNCKEFSQDLAQQASQVIPADISENDKKFIVEIILRFCQMAGDALINEKDSKLTAQEASLVTQFIGEWIFHKSIDIIRAQIEPQYREGILQKIAFTVFDIAKKAIENKIPQEQLINLVEAQVKKCFTKAMNDIKERGIINEQTQKNALSQSNIDTMAIEQVEEETRHDISCMSDKKLIKLASFAILIRNFPMDKLKNVLQKFDKPERDVLIKYLKMPDLEEKLDLRATMKCFEEIKNTLPEVVVISYDKAYSKMCKIIKNSQRQAILDMIKDERSNIKEFVLSCYDKKRKKIPAYIADTISKYIEENVS